MLFKSLFLIFILIKEISTQSDCFTQLISTETPYLCVQSGLIPASYLELPTFARKLAVFITLQPQLSCGNPGTFDFLTVSMLVLGTRRKVMRISYDSLQKNIVFTYEDVFNILPGHTVPVADFYAAPYNLYIALDLASGTLNIGGVVDSNIFGKTVNALSYNDDWSFGSSTEITLCSDTGSATPIQCVVHNLKVSYSLDSFTSPTDFIDNMKLIADYKFNEESLANSKGSLGPATLSNPPPTWIPEGGLEFTAETQYFNLPNFVPSGLDPTVVTSLAVALQIKIDTQPSSLADLFYFNVANLPSASSKIFRLKIDPNMFLETEIDGVNKPVTTTPINLGEWTMIYASYIYTIGGAGASVIYINGVETDALPFTQNANGPSHFSASDTLSVSPGWTGQIRRFQIYSPATLRLNQGDCVANSCDFDSNQGVHPTCLTKSCTTPGSFSSFGTCESCPEGCDTCSDPTTCGSCESLGYYLDGTSCKKCLPDCETCDDDVSCLTCNPGWGLYPDVCVLCPEGTYLSNTQTCEDCRSDCKACVDDQGCLSCPSDQGFYNSVCQICPSGTFLSSTQNCEECPMHCKTCIDTQTCKTCTLGYGLLNNFCVLCPIGTYLTENQICSGLSETLEETIKNSQLVNSAATQVANVISKGNSVSLSATVSGKIFSQIKYLNIHYSEELQVALLTWLPSFISLGLTPNMPDSVKEKIPNRKVPSVFQKYEVPSSFLINFWENLGIVAFTAILWLFFKGMELILQTKQSPPNRIATGVRKVRFMVQNFMFAVLFGVYGDLVLFSLIEYRNLEFGWNLSLLSFLISAILLIVMFLGIRYQFKILFEYQKIKKQASELEKFTKAHEGSQVFFKDYKDYSLSPQLFPFFLSARDIIFSLVLATMFEYPLGQTLIIAVLDLLMIAYLFIKKPFQSTFDFIQQLFFEFIGLAVNASVFVNAIFDTGEYQTPLGRKNVGKLIIICNMMFNFVSAVFMILIILQALLEFYKNQKEKRQKKLKDRDLHSRLQQKPSFLDTSQSQTSLTNPGIIVNNDSISFQQESFDLNFIPNPQRNPRFNRPFRPSYQVQRRKEFSHNLLESNYPPSVAANLSDLPPIQSRQDSLKLKPYVRQDIQPLPQGIQMFGRRSQPKMISNSPKSAFPRR